MDKTVARARYYSHILPSDATNERTHDFTPYSTLNAFSMRPMLRDPRSDVITSTHHRSRCSRCYRTTSEYV